MVVAGKRPVGALSCLFVQVSRADEGVFEDGRVTCPWHQSTFRLADGEVVHGPVVAPQPRYDVQELDGRLLLRRHAAG